MTLPILDKPPYTIDNLPYGVIKTVSDQNPRCAIAIGQHALDLAEYAGTGRLANLEAGHNFKLKDIFAEVSQNAGNGDSLASKRLHSLSSLH